MRNRFGGKCYRCGEWVAPGDGHFERFRASFRVQHALCAIEHRGTPDPARQADEARRREMRARGTGKSAQRARRQLRERENAD